MKSYCKGLAITREHVWEALMSWKDGESGRKNAHRISEEYGSEDALVDEIYQQIRSRNLSFRPIHRYQHVEPTNGKVRVIGVESVKQQVCDYLAITLMQPLYDARIGYYQVAAVKGKGQRMCRAALRKWVRRSKYHAKLDIRKCYPSTKPSVAMSMYERYVKSEDVLYVVSCLLATYDGGLEIGSYFALKTMQLILSFAYHHVETLGRRRRGRWIPLIRHQIWHLDDMLLISNCKRDLRMAVRSLEKYLESTFRLSVKPWKLKVVSQSEPLDIGGWVVRVRRDGGGARVSLRHGTFLRTMRTFARFRRSRSLALARRCASRWGQLVHSDSSKAVTRRGIRPLFVLARHIVSAYDSYNSPAHGLFTKGT